MHKVFLGIGGNIGNKDSNFKKVIILIEQLLGTVVQRSSVYETSPWGFSSDDQFWNQVVVIKTELEPGKLLKEIHLTEKLFNRIRPDDRSLSREMDHDNYSSREMDIDILYYDNISLDSAELIIPHPLISKRLFVLVPLTEIAPGYLHPLLNLTNKQLLANCEDMSSIKKIELL